MKIYFSNPFILVFFRQQSLYVHSGSHCTNSNPIKSKKVIISIFFNTFEGSEVIKYLKVKD